MPSNQNTQGKITKFCYLKRCLNGTFLVRYLEQLGWSPNVINWNASAVMLANTAGEVLIKPASLC